VGIPPPDVKRWGSSPAYWKTKTGNSEPRVC
jgi:hypothetical protein